MSPKKSTQRILRKLSHKAHRRSSYVRRIHKIKINDLLNVEYKCRASVQTAFSKNALYIVFCEIRSANFYWKKLFTSNKLWNWQ